MVVRLAQLKEGAEVLPVVVPIEKSFVDPMRYLEITEHHLTLEDTPRWQFLRLERPTLILAFQIVVQSVYPGERYDDTAIAEVLFPLLEEDLVSPPTFLPVTGESNPTLWLLWTAAFTGVVLVAFVLFWTRKNALRGER